MAKLYLARKKAHLLNYFTMPDKWWLDVKSSEYPLEMERIRIPKFNYEKAFEIGTLARTSAKKEFPGKPVVIDISLPNGHSLFRMTTGIGSSLDDDYWIKQNRETAMRFGCSSFFRANKFRNSVHCSDLFQYSLDYEKHGYEGGGIPIFTESCEFPVACLTVSGLNRIENQWLVVESIKDYVNKINDSVGKYTAADEYAADCAVCSSKVKFIGPSVEAPCNHVFHDSCLLRWVTHTLNCPVCRFPLSPRQLLA